MSLDDKEVVELGKEILKAEATPPFLIENLQKLKAGVVPSEATLRNTKIGVSVSKLKQHKDPEVARLASGLVLSWRAAIKTKDKKGGTSGLASPSGSNTPTPSATRSPAPPQPAQTPTKTKVLPEKRNADSDGVAVNKTGDKARDGCLKLMYNGLAFMSEEESDNILTVAQSIEAAAWSQFPPKSGDASPEYRAKIRSLFQNLKIKTNSGLRKGVLSGEIKPERFVRLTEEELQSPERQAEIAQLEKENDHESRVPMEAKSITAAFTCGKCKQKKVSYTQAQTRSADEPMTTFCECLNCGNRWKFS